MKMKITAIAPWFGAKRYLADRIVEQLGPHRCFWEPFCGSMAVLLAKPEVSQETVNDLHGDLINLARVIQHAHYGPMLYRRLRRCLVHEDLFRSLAREIKDRAWERDEIDTDAYDRAFAFFYSSWMGRNGVIGTAQNNNNFCVRYTMNGGIQGTRFAAAVDSIPAWQRRMRQVTILRRDGLKLLEKIADDARVAIYCDPPYLTKGATYVHDFTAAEHVRLAELAGRFKRARVVVSYYAHPELDRLYPGWSRLQIDVAKSLVQQGKRDKSGGAIAPEVLLVNGPIFGAHQPAQLF
jgi:DNA adenine methylase